MPSTSRQLQLGDIPPSATSPDEPQPPHNAGPSRRKRWRDALDPADQRALLHIGMRVAAARKTRRLTRAELAVAANLNAAHIGTIERGENNTTLLSLSRLAGALGVSPSELLTPIR